MTKVTRTADTSAVVFASASAVGVQAIDHKCVVDVVDVVGEGSRLIWLVGEIFAGARAVRESLWVDVVEWSMELRVTEVGGRIIGRKVESGAYDRMIHGLHGRLIGGVHDRIIHVLHGRIIHVPEEAFKHGFHDAQGPSIEVCSMLRGVYFMLRRACPILRRVYSMVKRACTILKRIRVMLNRACSMLGRGCSMLKRVCFMLKKACSILERARVMLNRSCSMLEKTCFMMKRACSMMKRACFMLKSV